jgi:hypothetical protein
MTAYTIEPDIRNRKAARPSVPRPAKSHGRHGDRFMGDRQSGGALVMAADMRTAVAVLVSLAIAACATMSAPHIGKTARPENRVPLAALPQTETTWAAKDLKLHYLAVRSGDNLQISGFVAFDSNLAKFPVIKAFRVYLHYLDADGRVLDSKLVWATGVNSEYRFVRWTFERQWPVPPAATALGFSYRGSVSESGGDASVGQSRTGWEVYQAP